MGWSGMTHDIHTTNKQAWMNDYLNKANSGDNTCLAYAFRAFNSRCWSVWKHKSGGMYLMVTLIDRRQKNGMADIMFKDVTTDCGPYYYDCPAKFVKMVAQDAEYSNAGYHKNWLERWNQAKNRKMEIVRQLEIQDIIKA